MHTFLFLLILFSTTFLCSSNIWSDDIWFIFPSKGQPVSGIIDIKIYPPQSSVSINIWIEHDQTDSIVWMGTVSSENNYTISVDTKRFKPGKYKIEALYYLYGKDYDGDIDIWVNGP
ncbi:MAG: hypothetical protein KFW21_02020 [Spirochaetota bacterium]|nr:hypothetical protein [Spirochaetota bacterium]